MKSILLSLMLMASAYANACILIVDPSQQPDAVVDQNGIRYTIKDGEATAKRVLGETRPMGPLVIDSLVYDAGQSYPVTTIKFNEIININDSITSVIIPNSVREIKERGFYNFAKLTEVVIPNSVTTIGNSAFYYCSSLESLYIPNSVDSICGNITGNTGKLTRIVVDKDNKTFDSREDCNCIIRTATNEIVNGCSASHIPSSVTAIGEYAFRRCSFTSFHIPSTVKRIGSHAFDNCRELTTITFPEDASFGEWVFSDCKALTTFRIPDTWTQIPVYTFGGTGLTHITIPSSITKIGKGAFEFCDQLAQVEMSNSVDTICDNAFTYCNKLTSISIPTSVKSIGSGAFCGSGLHDITLPNSITKIEENAFEGCTNLKEITIPHSVTEIGERAFYDCWELSAVNIPNSVTKIGENAFYGCDLSSIIIPNSVTEIGNNAFRGNNLTTVTIPASVTELGKSAFSENGALTKITVNNDNAVYDSRRGSNCIIETATNTLVQGCKTTIIPPSVQHIGNGAFYAMELDTITIPNTILSIGVRSYAGNDFSSVNIPKSVKKIAERAFAGCDELTSVTFASGNVLLSPNAFAECNELTDFYILDEEEPEVCFNDGKGNPYTIVLCGEGEQRPKFDDWTEEATLHVPFSMISHYRGTAPWNDFSEIEPLTEEEMRFVPRHEENALEASISEVDASNLVNSFRLNGIQQCGKGRCIMIEQYQNGNARKVIK